MGTDSGRAGGRSPGVPVVAPGREHAPLLLRRGEVLAEIVTGGHGPIVVRGEERVERDRARVVARDEIEGDATQASGWLRAERAALSPDLAGGQVAADSSARLLHVVGDAHALT